MKLLIKVSSTENDGFEKIPTVQIANPTRGYRIPTPWMTDDKKIEDCQSVCPS